MLLNGNNYHQTHAMICDILNLHKVTCSSWFAAVLAAEWEEILRKYQEVQDRKLMQVVCNRCGRALEVEGGCVREGCVSVTAPFGYFSRKDGTVHHFDLCEDCYDAIIAQFAIPVAEEAETELL